MPVIAVYVCSVLEYVVTPNLKTQYTTEAVCLRTTDYREHDKLVTLFTPEFGRVSAVVRGVKRHGSKLASATVPLTLNRIQLVKGKALDSLIQAETLRPFPKMHHDLTALYAAMGCAEVIYRIGQDMEPDSEHLFHCLVETFSALEAGLPQTPETLVQGNTTLSTEQAAWLQHLPKEIQMALWSAWQLAFFLRERIEHSGFMPSLQHCVVTQQPFEWASVPQNWLPFSFLYGGVVHPEWMHQPEVAHAVVPVRKATLQFLLTPTLLFMAPSDAGVASLSIEQVLLGYRRLIGLLGQYAEARWECRLKTIAFFLDLLPDQTTPPFTPPVKKSLSV